MHFGQGYRNNHPLTVYRDQSLEQCDWARKLFEIREMGQGLTY